MTLLVDKKMACMVKSELFKSPDDAFSFMVIIATTLCEGEVSKEGLYELRDQMLQDLKLDAAPLAVALKRPAAAVGGLQLLLAKKPRAAIAAAMPAEEPKVAEKPPVVVRGSRDGFFAGLIGSQGVVASNSRQTTTAAMWSCEFFKKK